MSQPASSAAATVPTRQAIPRRGDVTRERILAAAAVVLARRGYAGTTLGEIAELAGTKAGSLYYHFDSRDDLIAEILNRGVIETHENALRAIRSLPSGADARDRLAAAIRAHVRYLLTENDIARAALQTLGQAPPNVQGPAIERHRTYGRFLTQLIDDAVAEGFLATDVDSRVLRLLVAGAANWSTAWYSPSGPSSVDDIADLLVRIVFGDLTPRTDSFVSVETI